MATTLLTVDSTMLVTGSDLTPQWLEAVELTMTFAQAAARAATRSERGPSSDFMLARGAYPRELIKNLQLLGWNVPGEVSTVTLEEQTFSANRLEDSLATKALDPVAIGFPSAGYQAPSAVLTWVFGAPWRHHATPGALKPWWSAAYDESKSSYLNVGVGSASATGEAHDPVALAFTLFSFNPSEVKHYPPSARARPDAWRYLIAGNLASVPRRDHISFSARLVWSMYSSTVDELRSRLSDRLSDHVHTLDLDS
jgi:hypothetical protein